MAPHAVPSANATRPNSKTHTGTQNRTEPNQIKPNRTEPVSQQRPLLPQQVLQPRRPRGPFPGPFRAVRLGFLECPPGGVKRLSRLVGLLRTQLLGLAKSFLGLL